MAGGAWSNDQLNSLFIYDINGNLILTVTENGITYIAPLRRFDLDTTGLKVQPEPADGGYVLLTTDSSFGAVIHLQVENSAVPGVTFTPGFVYVDEVVFPGNESRAYTAIQSPRVNGLAVSTIAAAGETSTNGRSQVSVSTDDFVVSATQQYGYGPRAVGTGWITGGHATGNFGPIGNAETIFIAAPETVFLAGHAYKVVVWGQATVSVAPNRPVWRIRQSSDGTANLGTQVCISSKPHVNTAMHDACWSGVFGVGANDVQTFMVLTMTSGSAAFTVTALNSPFQFDIYDIGESADHPGIINIT